MWLASILAIALCLNAIASGQASAVPTPSETTVPADRETPQDPAKENKAASSASADSPNVGAPNAATKRHKSPVQAPATDGAPRKIVVRKGGASEPAARIALGMTPAEAARQRQNAEQLLGSAGDRLKHLAGRVLNAQQQETAAQARNYMEGARAALQEGDLRRASTLAEKAHLLSDDLTAH
jgi:hypothetical protein